MWSCALSAHQESSFVSRSVPQGMGEMERTVGFPSKEEEGDPFPGTHSNSVHGSDLPLLCHFPLQQHVTQSLSLAPHVNGGGVERYSATPLISCKTKHPQHASLYKLQKEETKETISLI